MKDCLEAGCTTAHAVGIDLDDLVSGRLQDVAGLVNNSLAMTEVTRILDRDPAPTVFQPGKPAIDKGLSNGHRDIQCLRCSRGTSPMVIPGQMGRTAGRRGNNHLVSAEGSFVLCCQIPCGVGLAVVGRKGSTARLIRWRFHLVAGHLEQGHGGVVHRPEPLVLDASGEKGDRSRLPRAGANTNRRSGPSRQRSQPGSQSLVGAREEAGEGEPLS